MAGSRALLRGIETDANLEVRKNVAFFAVPLRGQQRGAAATAYCVHGLEDNPKELLAAGATLFGSPLGAWLAKCGISERDVWPVEVAPGERSLWTARLHPVGGPEALEIAVWMQSRSAVPDPADIAAWLRSPRVSFADVFERIDYAAAFRRREALVRECLRASVRRELAGKRDPRQYLRAIGGIQEFADLRDALEDWAGECRNPLIAARIRTFEAELLLSSDLERAVVRAGGSADGGVSVYRTPSRRRKLARDAQTAALRAVAQAVASGVARTEPLDLGAVRADRVEIDSPARIDFGGGWTDTPPQCLERGGVILSAAVRLNGKYPIGVTAERIPEREIRLENANARGTGVLRRAADLPLFQRLGDPYALVKAALAVVGLGGQTSEGPAVYDGEPLERRLEAWGHGLRIVTRSDVPKGSGLGTSSILGAAAIACLRRLFGAPLETETIFRQVLYLEQLLTSGGGWQDQLGALEPGIKLASVSPDPRFVMRPRVEALALERGVLAELNRRLVLFYVGKRRVAFNMLREIVCGYLAGNPDVTAALRAIHDLAHEMREALEAGDFDRLGAQMTRTRLLYRLMCPETTSPTLEAIFAAAAPYVSGGKCAGAGGGGFVLLMARGPREAQRLRERLKEFSWRELGEFYDFDVDERGLHETGLRT